MHEAAQPSARDHAPSAIFDPGKQSTVIVCLENKVNFGAFTLGDLL